MEVKAEETDKLKAMVYRAKHSLLTFSVDEVGRLELSESLRNFIREILQVSKKEGEVLNSRSLQELESLGVNEIVEISTAVELVIRSRDQSPPAQYVAHQFNFFPSSPPMVPQCAFKNMFGLPAVVSAFTGREAELSQLSNNIGQLQVVTQKIAGPGGIGKSQLANHFARTKLREGCYQWVVWLTVGANEEIQQENNKARRNSLNARIESLGRILGLKVEGYLDSELIVFIYQKLCPKGRGLIVFDDVEDYSMIKAYLPEDSYAEKIHVVITSRNALIWGNEVHRVQLGVFSEKEAVLYLSKVISEWKFDQAHAKVLVELMGRFPLALAQAVAYIENNTITLAEYIALYRQTKENKKKLLNSLSFAQDEHQMSVWTTLQMSLKKINNSSAVNILRTFSFFLPETPMHVSFLKSCVRDDIESNDAIAILKRYSLIRESSIENHFEMHQLVQHCVLLANETEKLEIELINIARNLGNFLVSITKTPQDRNFLIHMDYLLKKLEELHQRESNYVFRSIFHQLVPNRKFSALSNVIDFLYYRRGHYFRERSEPLPAIYSFGKALSYVHDKHVTTEFIPLCEFYMGAMLLEANDIEWAIDYIKISLWSFKSFRFKSEVIDAEILLGKAYAAAGYFKGAMHYYSSAMEKCRSISEGGIRIAYCERAIGLIYLQLSDVFRAKFYLELALKKYKRDESRYYLEIVLISAHLGDAYLHSDYQRSIEWYRYSIELMLEMVRYKGGPNVRGYFDDVANRTEFLRCLKLTDQIIKSLLILENKINNDNLKNTYSELIADVHRCIYFSLDLFKVLGLIARRSAEEAVFEVCADSGWMGSPDHSLGLTKTVAALPAVDKIAKVKLLIKITGIRELILIRFPGSKEYLDDLIDWKEKTIKLKRLLILSKLDEQNNYICPYPVGWASSERGVRSYQKDKNGYYEVNFVIWFFVYWNLLLTIGFLAIDMPFSIAWWRIFIAHLLGHGLSLGKIVRERLIIKELPKLNLEEYEEEDEDMYHNSLYYYTPPIMVGLIAILYQLELIPTYTTAILGSVSAAVSTRTCYKFGRNMFRLLSRPTIKPYKDELVEDYNIAVAPLVASDPLSEKRREIIKSIQSEVKRTELFRHFHQSAELGLVEELRVLIKLNIPIDCLSPSDSRHGETALHSAVRNGHEECVKLLLRAGADPFYLNDDGQTPYDLGVDKPNLLRLFKTESESSLSIML